MERLCASVHSLVYVSAPWEGAPIAATEVEFQDFAEKSDPLDSNDGIETLDVPPFHGPQPVPVRNWICALASSYLADDYRVYALAHPVGPNGSKIEECLSGGMVSAFLSSLSVSFVRPGDDPYPITLWFVRRSKLGPGSVDARELSRNWASTIRKLEGVELDATDTSVRIHSLAEAVAGTLERVRKTLASQGIEEA